MASRILKFESYAHPQCRYPQDRDAYLTRRQDVHAVAVAESLAASESEGVRCAKGCIVGMGMEALAVLGIYGLWELSHLFR